MEIKSGMEKSLTCFQTEIRRLDGKNRPWIAIKVFITGYYFDICI